MGWTTLAALFVSSLLIDSVTASETSPQSRPDEPELACREDVLQQAWELLGTAGYGRMPTESGAFVIRDDGGALRFQRWPRTGQFHQLTWRGERPRDVVAIIHTHPPNLVYPSSDDKTLARRTGLPVYVLTRLSISVTSGQETIVVWKGDWNLQRAGGNPRSLCRTRSAPIQLANAR